MVGLDKIIDEWNEVCRPFDKIVPGDVNWYPYCCKPAIALREALEIAEVEHPSLFEETMDLMEKKGVRSYDFLRKSPYRKYFKDVGTDYKKLLRAMREHALCYDWTYLRIDELE